MRSSRKGSGVSARPSSAAEGDFPWWLVAMIGIGSVLAILIAINGIYAQVFSTVIKGVGITVFVTLVAFALASLWGLAIAMLGMADSIILRQISRFYIETIRGIPVLVVLFYVAFVGAPAIVSLINWLMTPLIEAGWLEPMLVRDFSLTWRAILALTICYAAFIAEIFRAGIEAVDQGQIEAAKALGLGRAQRFRLVIFPQAIRTIFPPLSNDFVSMVKDSSLVSVLGVMDVTQLGKVYAAGSFRFFETYSIVAYIYLILTVGLSLVLRRVEKSMRRSPQG
ncbi:amino acid ABC transporter permease [Rhizobium sp. CFBP 13717]|uniref:amino acid ABC transporter permease n=1 Tax=unclassified Rhizobium TaxID=2613769 RepID=UPI00177E1E50|nr:MULTISPECIES: amino acid ABC transporter permease [unclassified Rhizobium]MBD8687970.1 amino acid ABC transporter permease [Rhizobium sp. CFBP 13644]MBD8692425.1 amino acid ABC transporter permease [Rhizobium sp. CFBP 13717]